MHLYLSGPMSGLPEHNFPEFARYAKALRDLGHTVISPAEGQVRDSYEEYIRDDILMILQVEAIAVMPGWEKSRGCKIELTVADGVGLTIYDAEGLIGRNAPVKTFTIGNHNITRSDETVPEAPEETVLQEADRLVSSDRGADYGHPYWDFSKTAQMWSAIFGCEVAAEQVPLAMIAVKISRELNRHKRDNLVDIGGYAKTLDMVVEKRAELAATM